MPDQELIKGSTSYLAEVTVRSAATGLGLTGLAAGSVNFCYWREGAGSGTSVTPDGTMVAGTWKTGGWVELDSTNRRGLYQVGIPDAALATGANAVTLTFQATGAIDKAVRILLVDVDTRNATSFGLSRLDAATTSRAAPADILVTPSQKLVTNASGYVTAASVAGNVTGSVASVTGAVGSVTGAVASVTGDVGGNVVGHVASVTGAVGSVTGAVASVTGAVGSVTGNVGGSVASVAGAVGSVTGNVGGSVASVVGNVGGNVTGTVASVVGDVAGNVVGHVASVTGAVGSVTGNVGGNVTGTVASVVGAVGSVTGGVGGSIAGSVASVTGSVGGNVTGSVASVVGAVGSVTGNVGGTVASVVGAVGSVTGNVGGNVVGSVGSLTGYVAPDNADVAAIKVVTDHLATALQSDGGSGYQYTTTALALGPTGAGTDWSSGERSQIRQALGLTGTTAATVGTGDVQTRLAASAYTAPDNATLGTLAAAYTAGRAVKLDNLDVLLSSRAAPGDLLVTPANKLATDGVGHVGLAGSVTVGGYGAGMEPETRVLASPANKLVTDGSGRVTAASVTGSVGSLTGYTAPDNATIAAIAAQTALIPVGGPLAASAYSAPDNAGIAAVRTTADRLGGMIAAAGGGAYQYTAPALALAPTGGGGGATDWSDPERAQIRQALGLTGDAAPTESTGDVRTRLAASAYTAPDNADIVQSVNDLAALAGAVAALPAPDNAGIAQSVDALQIVTTIANRLALMIQGAGSTTQFTAEALALAPAPAAHGAHPIALTVFSGGIPVAGASISVRSGPTLVAGPVATDEAGSARVNLDDGDYSLIVRTDPRYATLDPVALTVAGPATVPLVLTARVVPGASDPHLCRVYAYAATGDGAPLSGLPITFTLVATGPVESGSYFVDIGKATVLRTDAAGYFSQDLLKSASLTPIGDGATVTWHIACAPLGIDSDLVLSDDVVNLSALFNPLWSG